MRSKQKKVRLAISGLLLAAVVGTGIYAYNLDSSYVDELGRSGGAGAAS